MAAAAVPVSPHRRHLNVLLLSTYELGRQPFGLASPTAWLRREGFTVTCADLAVQEFPADAAASADLVALYVPMHTATRIAATLIPRLKSLNPATHICCYGLYGPPNAEYLRRLGASTILGGEFETGLLHLCERLSASNGRPDREQTATGQPEPEISLDRQRFLLPDRSDLPELTRYARMETGSAQPITVGYTEASRGCKHLCRHCPVVPVYEGKFRIVQEEIVLEDIRQQVEAGAGHITFGDPDFFNGIGHAMPVVEALHAQFPRVTYDVTVKIEHLLRHADCLRVLRDTGCAFVTSAVESTDDRVLAILDKGHTREDFVQVARRFRETGLVLSPTFVTFTPWTTLESNIDLLELILELDLVDCVAPIQWAIRLLIPEGSRLLELSEAQSLIDPFEPDMLGYRWKHPDPRVDKLFEEVFDVACASGAEECSRRQVFTRVWEIAHSAVDRPAPRVGGYLPPSPATLPYLTEPWYC